jgi:hypothetical protein
LNCFVVHAHRSGHHSIPLPIKPSFERWSDQPYTQSSYDVEIVDPCGVQLVLEYYENTGQSRVSLDWHLD